MDYEKMRILADSWGLLYLFVVFCAAVLWVFRPGSKKYYDAAGEIPLKED